MDNLTVHLDLPRDLLGALDVPENQLGGRLRELIALELFREGRISTGKGAEFLELSKKEFVLLLARNGILYFSESPDELKEEVERLEQELERKRI